MSFNQFYPTNIENRCTQNTRLIEYFPMVLMQLCELYMYEIDINIKLQTSISDLLHFLRSCR